MHVYNTLSSGAMAGSTAASSLTQDPLDLLSHLSYAVEGASIFVLHVSFDDGISPSQDATRTVLRGLRKVLGRLYQNIFVRMHDRPSPVSIAPILQGCMDAVHLVQNELYLVQYTCGKKDFVATVWTEAIEALQHYQLILERCLECIESAAPRSLVKNLPTLADLECLNILVRQHLERQFKFQASQCHDPYPRPPSPAVCSHCHLSSTYVTPPQSVQDDEGLNKPPLPDPPVASSPSSTSTCHRTDKSNETTAQEVSNQVDISQQKQYTLEKLPEEPHNGLKRACDELLIYQEEMARDIERARLEERQRVFAILRIPVAQRLNMMMDSIKRWENEAVDILLDAGVDPNSAYKKDSPLSLAARVGCCEIVQILRDRGANIEQPSPSGSRALMSAVENNQMGTVALLLRLGAEVNAQSTHGETAGDTPLMKAVRNQNYPVCERLLEYRARTDIPSQAGDPLLHVAVQKGHKNVLSLILRRSETLANQVDSDGNTALHLAARAGRLDLSRMLLEHPDGARQLEIANEKGETPFHCTVRAKSLELLELFAATSKCIHQPDRKDKTPLHYAVEEACPDIVGALCQRDANPSAKDMDGKAPLHYAAEMGLNANDLMHKLLGNLDADVDPDIEDAQHKTPMHYAVLSRNDACIRVLLSHHASPKHRQPCGKYIFEYVMDLAPGEDAERLAQAFLSVHPPKTFLTTTFGFPVLAKAIKMGQVALTELFCKHDASLVNEIPSAESECGPALHEAIRTGNTDLVKLLCSFEGTAVDICTEDGTTPLYWAIEHGHMDMAKTLIAAHADADTPHPRTGLPPLFLAVKKLSTDLVKMMIANGANPATRIPGQPCGRCKKADKKTRGRNARCLLMEIDETPNNKKAWNAINDALLPEIKRRKHAQKSG